MITKLITAFNFAETPGFQHRYQKGKHLKESVKIARGGRGGEDSKILMLPAYKRAWGRGGFSQRSRFNCLGNIFLISVPQGK